MLAKTAWENSCYAGATDYLSAFVGDHKDEDQAESLGRHHEVHGPPALADAGKAVRIAQRKPGCRKHPLQGKTASEWGKADEPGSVETTACFMQRLGVLMCQYRKFVMKYAILGHRVPRTWLRRCSTIDVTTEAGLWPGTPEHTRIHIRPPPEEWMAAVHNPDDLITVCLPPGDGSNLAGKP